MTNSEREIHLRAGATDSPRRFVGVICQGPIAGQLRGTMALADDGTVHVLTNMSENAPVPLGWKKVEWIWGLSWPVPGEG